jgi:hypothetical protein
MIDFSLKYSQSRWSSFFSDIYDINFISFFLKILNSSVLKEYYLNLGEEYYINLLNPDVRAEFIKSIQFVRMSKYIKAFTYNTLYIFVNSNPAEILVSLDDNQLKAVYLFYLV